MINREREEKKCKCTFARCLNKRRNLWVEINVKFDSSCSWTNGEMKCINNQTVLCLFKVTDESVWCVMYAWGVLFLVFVASRDGERKGERHERRPTNRRDWESWVFVIFIRWKWCAYCQVSCRVRLFCSRWVWVGQNYHRAVPFVRIVFFVWLFVCKCTCAHCQKWKYNSRVVIVIVAGAVVVVMVMVFVVHFVVKIV